ncbi:hypothetical protein [Aquibacillus kalidii]|uniref:hypothetical protein n=1 Tax=Aquibacillus kalidii TaxID=2762597 RepID=UPI0016469F84|nr:hypothetical protein [Aquibacillus kalidii]
MKVILESFRFVFIFIVLEVALSLISYIILYPIIGNIAEAYYGWTAAIGTFIIMFFLYRKKGWGKDYFNKSIFWLSVIFIVLLSLLIPDSTPEHFHATIYAYSYGFPFKFLTLYNESGAKFLIQNIFSGRFTRWDVSMGGILGNFILFYLFLQFIFLKFSKKA